MSTHNACFPGEVRKISYGYPLLSGAMYELQLQTCAHREDFDQPVHSHNLISESSLHNQNMPIQIYWKYHHPKLKVFR